MILFFWVFGSFGSLRYTNSFASMNSSCINDLIINQPNLESSVDRFNQQEVTNPQITAQSSFDEINSNRQTDFNISVQKIISPSENERNKMKALMSKYKPNQNLPMVIITVSVNLNRNQFLELIKNMIQK